MSDFGDVIWRLTVRDSQGKIVFGPRTYLADKTMRAAAARWEGKDRSLLREFAVRGAWQNMDAIAVSGPSSPWHEEAPIFPDDEMTPEEQAAWDALTPEEQIALVFAPLPAVPLPMLSVKRGGIRHAKGLEDVEWCQPDDIILPQPLTQAEWERRATEQLGPSPRDQASSAEIDAWNAMTPEERGTYLESIDPRRKRG